MTERIVNEYINPKRVVNGNGVNDNSHSHMYDNHCNSFEDECGDLDNGDTSDTSELTNAMHLNDAIKQRDSLIKQLSERLQVTLKGRDDDHCHAQSMAFEIEQLKLQMRGFTSMFANSKGNDSGDTTLMPVLVDFECQTEWTEDGSISSIEFARRQNHDVQDIGVGMDFYQCSLMEDKSEQTISDSLLYCDTCVQTEVTDLHEQCRNDLQRVRIALAEEFTEQTERLQTQVKRDRDLYQSENKKLIEEIENLKSQIVDLERKRRKHEDSDGDDHLVQSRKRLMSDTPSPLPQSSSSPLCLLIPNDRASSLSPILANVQSRNNQWPHNHHSYNAPAHYADSECWHLYAAQTNSRLLHVLSDLVKTFLDTEHDIQKQLEELGLESGTGHGTGHASKEDLIQGLPSLGEDNNERLSQGETNDLCEDGPDLTPSSSNLIYMTPPSTYSVSHTEVEDDVVLGASRRLRTAVDRVLKILNDVVSAHQEHDVNALVKRNDELLNELNEECSRRDKLTAQLLQSENKANKFEKEINKFTEMLIDYNETKRETETMKMKIAEYESERGKWINDNQRLEKEKYSFAQGLPQLQQIGNAVAQCSTQCTDKGLKNDNESLTSDIRQLQQERIALLKRIHALALETESLRSERDEILEDKRRESEDYCAQIEANEKSLASYRRFIDEQTHEREIERDEFNKELNALIEKFKDKDKSEAKLRSQYEEIESQLSQLSEEKMINERQWNDIHFQLKLSNQEIADLRHVISQMEQDNEKFTHLERELRSKVNELSDALELQIKINEDVQNDSFANAMLQSITSKTLQIQNTLGDENESDTSLECSYSDVHVLSEKLNALNECIDKLVIQNNSLKTELEHSKNNYDRRYNEITKEKESLGRNIMEIMRSNEVLQEELNAKHLQLSALKSRLESSLDSVTLKTLIEEMQQKLIAEEQKCNVLDNEVITLKQQVDDRNNKAVQLFEEITKLKMNLQAVDKERITLHIANEELRSKLTAGEAIASTIKLKSEERTNDTRILSEEVESQRAQLKLVYDENANLCEENKELKLKLSTNEKIIASQRQQIEDKHNKVLNLIERADSLSNKLMIVETQKSDLLNENEELKLKLSSADTILISLKQQVEDKNVKSLHLIEKVDTLTNRLKTVENERGSSIKESDELRMKLITAERMINGVKQQLENELSKTVHLTEEVNSLKYRLQLIESEKECLIRENATLRLKLKSADEIILVLRQQIEDGNNKILHLTEIIDQLNDRIKLLESENVQKLMTNDNRSKAQSNDNSLVKLKGVHSTRDLSDDDEKLQTITNQFLWKLKRLVSQKNALIYQKKYLLHVLGGFQLTERATLALLANMNVTVDESDSYKSPLSRFRSAAFVIIAISRMKFIVKKWKFRNHNSNAFQLKTNFTTPMKTFSSSSLNSYSPQSQTNSTLQEFVNRLQKLHDTLGLRSGQI